MFSANYCYPTRFHCNHLYALGVFAVATGNYYACARQLMVPTASFPGDLL